MSEPGWEVIQPQLVFGGKGRHRRNTGHGIYSLVRDTPSKERGGIEPYHMIKPKGAMNLEEEEGAPAFRTFGAALTLPAGRAGEAQQVDVRARRMEEIPAWTGGFTLERLRAQLPFKRHISLCPDLYVQTTGAEWVNTGTRGLARVCVFKAKSFPPP